MDVISWFGSQHCIRLSWLSKSFSFLGPHLMSSLVTVRRPAPVRHQVSSSSQASASGTSLQLWPARCILYYLIYLYSAWRSYEQSGLTSSPRSYYWLTTNLCKFSTCHLPGTVLRRRNLYKLMTNCLPLVYHLLTSCLTTIVPLWNSEIVTSLTALQQKKSIWFTVLKRIH